MAAEPADRKPLGHPTGLLS